MQTRSKSGIFQPRIHPTLLLAHMESMSAKQALTGPTWLAAMKTEYDALINNGTWTLFSLPPTEFLLVANGFSELKRIPMIQSVNTKPD